MKILVASDIHGSAYYAEKVIEAFKQEGADRILLLGDLLYHGPRNPLTKDYNPAKVAELLNQYADKIWAVRGNCDSEVDQMVLDFNISADFMPIVLNSITVIATHGHVYGPEQLPKMAQKFLLLFGHIHLPIAQKESYGYLGNPGSTSLPKEGNPSSYGILEETKWIVKTFEGEEIAAVNFD